MALTTTPDTGIRPFVVLRPICIAGERVEIGAVVHLAPVVAAELRTAGKVAPASDAPAAAPPSQDTPSTPAAAPKAAGKKEKATP